MIAVDTSALMAILLDEPQSAACIKAIEEADGLTISAATIAEALIVAGRRNVCAEMAELIDGLGFDIVNVTASTARHVAEIYRLWGKGIHPAALNFGDCFSYAAATTHDCPLLFVGDDFAKTDIRSAI